MLMEEIGEEHEAEYHSRDFAWEELREEVEADASLSHHLSPFIPTAAATLPPSSEAWRSFHRRHAAGKFFKERRYLLKEFPELLNCGDNKKILEVGCGNGSTVLPILRASQSVSIYACDCSEDTLAKAKEILSDTKGVDVKERFHPFLLDVSKESFPDWLFCEFCQSSSFIKTANLFLDTIHRNRRNPCHMLQGENRCCLGGVDFVTLIFTFSAVPFNRMSTSVQQCVSVLKPGGLVLFRDYGLYDMTMFRFLPKQRVGFREYMRSDGTLSYFFSLDIARDIFCAAGLIELELEYCCIRSVNRKNGKKMQRVWVHGKFQKPMS